ncbi:MAG: DUF4142 domain-containing protein [Ferruginibacter sp.]
MKKIFFVCTSSIIIICSCNNDGESSTTTSDMTTTVSDNSTAVGSDGTGPHDTMNNNMNNNNTSGSMGTDKANNNTSGKMGNMILDAETSTFVTKAFSGGMMEIELGNLAKQKANSQRVKDFAAMIVNDHTAASNELKSMASASNMSMPSSMLPEHLHHIDMMKNKTGADFDKAYISMMVTDHKKDIGEFKKASTSLKNDGIKGFAKKTLPVLQKHLDSAQAISRKM